SAETRVAMHALAARALVADENFSSELLVERARHALEGASTEEDAKVAVALARTAIGRLEAQGALDRAYAMHQRLDRVRRNGLVPPASADELLDLARAAREAGNHAD